MSLGLPSRAVAQGTKYGVRRTRPELAHFDELMAAAKQAATTDAEKQRVALSEKEVWDYMVKGRAKYFARAKAPVGKATVPRLPDAGGDAARIDWSKAAALTGFTKREGGKWDSGVALKSDTSAPDRWTTRLAFPLDKLVPGGAKPGDVLRLNVIRVISVKGGRQVYVWSPESNVHEPDRFGEITLE